MDAIIRLFAGNVTIPNEQVDIPQVAANDTTMATIFSAIFVVLGGVAVLFLVIGAFRYIISNGDQGNIKRAKDTILYSIIGIIISLLAFTIVQFVLGSVIG